jgi:hypothetical protein
MSKQGAYTVIKGCAAILAIFLVLVVGVGLVTEWRFPKRFETTAKTYDELRGTNLIQGRWLPETMPKSMHDLTISWDLDVGRADATFFVAPEDIAKLTKGFNRVPADESEVEKFSRERDRVTETLEIDARTGHVGWSVRRKN